MQLQTLDSYVLSTGRTANKVVVRMLGRVPYEQSHAAMMERASTRQPEDDDEIWLLEHPAVYTQGTACELATFIASDIPIVKTDRGGQITYHGPGQIVMYPLLHLRKFELGVKSLVNNLEQCAVDVLASKGINAERREDAPGVYVNEAKIAALGLRIRRGNSYHGLSFNVGMDLSPFANIDPCGYQGLQVTQLSELLDNEGAHGDTPSAVGRQLAEKFCALI